MKTKLFAALLVCIILTSPVLPVFAADTLVKTDFEQESFAKTVDYFDYARAYATLHGIPTPSGFPNYHANMYMTYINTKGLHLLYAGLENITLGTAAYFRIPMQSFIMHYKTNNRTRDVVLSSTFLMLLAFNETSNSIHANSPDMNDTLWASFSMGFDLSALGATFPVLNSRTQTFPLTHSDDELQWSWGMKYTNLTALWWQTWIDPTNPHYNHSAPVAITVYDELTFTYNLTINPDTNTATLTENHIIGRMRHLLIGLPFLWVHYNSTGTYWLGFKISDDTIYDFIYKNRIKMSIVNFQTSILADHETYSKTPNGQNVTDAEIPISDSSISTYADDGEKICDADFGTKKTYRLYNYTAYPKENVSSTYDAITRTAKAAGFARNTGLFALHIGLMKFLPLVVVHMYPGLLARALETITNMSRANYFYIIAYPTYSGYRVEHDPTLTVYLTTSAAPTPPNIGFVLIIIFGVAVAAIGISIAVLKLRKKPQGPTQSTQPPLPPQ
jgi:hypothetical protein